MLTLTVFVGLAVLCLVLCGLCVMAMFKALHTRVCLLEIEVARLGIRLYASEHQPTPAAPKPR